MRAADEETPRADLFLQLFILFVFFMYPKKSYSRDTAFFTPFLTHFSKSTRKRSAACPGHTNPCTHTAAAFDFNARVNWLHLIMGRLFLSPETALHTFSLLGCTRRKISSHL